MKFSRYLKKILIFVTLFIFFGVCVFAEPKFGYENYDGFETIESYDFINGYVPTIGTYRVPGHWSKHGLLTCEVQETGLVLISESSDAILRSPKGLGISCDEMTGIKIKLKSNVDSRASVFFITDTDDLWKAAQSFNIKLKKSDDYVEYYIDCTTNSNWYGIVDCIRFDLLDEPGRLDIAKIEYVGFKDENHILIDDEKADVYPWFSYNAKDEFFVVLDKDSVLNRFLFSEYEWNNDNGKLYICGENTKFEFTIGSDKVLVNGKERIIKYKFDKYNDIPVIPLAFILDEMNVDYTLDENINISLKNTTVGKILEWRKNNPWKFEFDIPNDSENFISNAGSIKVSNGNLILTAGDSPVSVTGHDPGIVYVNSTITASEYEKVIIRYKYEFLQDAKPVENFDVHSNFQFYFDPSTNPGLSEAKCFRTRIDLTPVDDEGWHIAEFNLFENEHWDGIITKLRFDTSNHNGIYTLDYIRFVSKNELSETIKGDVTMDCVVDVNDAILVLQYSMFPQIYPLVYEDSVDFNNDCVVDVNDAILLLQHSMFPELYPIS